MQGLLSKHSLCKCHAVKQMVYVAIGPSRRELVIRKVNPGETQLIIGKYYLLITYSVEAMLGVVSDAMLEIR